MVSTKVMEIYMKGNKIVFVMFIIMLINSCASTFTGETNEIIDRINQLIKKQAEYTYIVKSSHLEILNGGLSPSFYLKSYGRTIQSQEGKDVVFIEYNGDDTLIQQLFIDKSEYDFIHVSKNNFYRNDTMRMDYDFDGVNTHVTIY